jgi:murein tripeptide amidase MpaA
VKVYFTDKAQLNELAARLDIWEVNNEEGYFVAWLSPAALRDIQQMGLHIEMQPRLTQQIYLSLQMSPGQTSGIPGYACYRTVEETYASLSDLATDHPDLATWTDVGDSWEKATPGGADGYDLNALVITNHNTPGPKPKFFVIAAIHAREYTTAELATRFAEKLINDYGVDPDITWLVDNYEFHLIPHANPDGRKHAEAGEMWRKNTDNDDGCTADNVDWGYYYGTDLNRNSSYKWNQGGSSSNACDQTYHGPSAASEPEVQTIETYARDIFPDQRGPNDDDAAPDDAEGVFITLHSYSEMVLFPWGWTDTQDAPNKTALQTLGRKFGYFNQYEVCSDCLYNASGTTDDFVYGDLGVASYTFELGTAFFQDCDFFESDIIPKNMPALIYAFKAARRPYQNPAGPDALNVAVSADAVDAGNAVTLTATLDDSRYHSGGHGDEPIQNIQAARYAIDTPSWKGGVTHAMSASDGAFDASSEDVTATIDTSGLGDGRHIIFVEGQDADGNWGVPTAVFLTVNAPCDAAQSPDDLLESIVNASDMQLSWQHNQANSFYEVWRSTQNPYFMPGDSDAELRQTLQAADGVFEYTDAGAVGDAGLQHYYLLRSGNACGDYAPTFLRGGEFDFSLTPGN